MIDAVDSVANTMTNILYQKRVIKSKRRNRKRCSSFGTIEKWRTLSTDGSTYDGNRRRDRRDRGNVR